MAPEMVTKDGHTEAVDWWSLGVAIFMMVRAQFTVLGVAVCALHNCSFLCFTLHNSLTGPSDTAVNDTLLFGGSI